MIRCTGACCTSITLSHPRAFLRRMMDAPQHPYDRIEAAKIWTLMRPRTTDPDEDRVTCRALAEAGCQLQAVDRPSMCLNYPYGGDKRCRWCGAQSDAEARGVAIARIA